jgi:hypothetical protein
MEWPKQPIRLADPTTSRSVVVDRPGRWADPDRQHFENRAVIRAF